MFLDKVNNLMKERMLSKSELSRLSGIPYTTIDGWYKKGTDSLRLTTLIKLSKFFDVTIDFLVDDKESERSMSLPEMRLLSGYRKIDAHGRKIVDCVLEEEMRRMQQESERKKETSEELIPLFSSMAAAGFAAPQEGVDFGLVKRGPDVPKRAQFAVMIEGDSMEPYIKDGETVYCVKDSEGVKVGDVGIFCVDGAYYCKQYVTDGENIFLVSLNRNRADADITLWGSGNRAVTLIGRVLTGRRIPKP